MLRRPDFQKFLDAEKVEIENMRKNGVFEWINLPAGERAIGSKFTYQIKRDKDGHIIQYKARLVASGFEQRKGIDYLDTSAPVARVTGFRMLVCIAFIRGWPTYSWDVDSAFLHCKLKQLIFMKPPSGFSETRDGRVLILKKTLYGLKQSAAEWHGLLSATFVELGYKAVDCS